MGVISCLCHPCYIEEYVEYSVAYSSTKQEAIVPHLELTADVMNYFVILIS